MLLKTEGINKQFNGVYALKNINFEVFPGEIHGLVGENGAGKSTLIKILTGVYKFDSGQIFWNGNPIRIQSPQESRKLGINVIHQDRNLVPYFNGYENAHLGLPYETQYGGFSVDWKKMRQKVDLTASRLGIDLDFEKPARLLNPPQKTMLEIVRAMMTECRLLILDEPTASLTDKESEIIFNIILNLKRNGVSILYVSHRMDEIFRLTDRITVLKNGELISTETTRETNLENIISLMTDHWVSEAQYTAPSFGDPLLTVENLKSEDNIVKDVSFSIRKGEILGFYGLGGSGRTETLEVIYGLRKKSAGTITLDQSSYENPTPSKSLQKGLVLINEDRRGKALIINLNIKQNVVLSTIDKYAKFGIVDESVEIDLTNEKIRSLAIRTTGPTQQVSKLSGGNQQKVVFAKALMSEPKVLLCDEPTQAVDVKTRSEIHRLLRVLANEGAAVVVVSSDIDEILNISDHIVVITNGKSQACLKNENLSSKQILSICYQGKEERC